MAMYKTEEQIKFDRVLGEVVKRYRLESGLTREDVSVDMDCNVSTIERLESGRSSVNLYSIVQMCRAMNISPAELVHEVSERTCPINAIIYGSHARRV